MRPTPEELTHLALILFLLLVNAAAVPGVMLPPGGGTVELHQMWKAAWNLQIT